MDLGWKDLESSSDWNNVYDDGDDDCEVKKWKTISKRFELFLCNVLCVQEDIFVQ